MSNIQLMQMYRAWANYLDTVFPSIHMLNIGSCASDEKASLDIYFELIPFYNENARMVAERNILYRMIHNMQEDSVPTSLADKIALMEMELGFSHKAFKLPCSQKCIHVAKKCQDLHVSGYGGVVTPHAGPISRGAALLHYFSNHLHLLRGKRILHFAPEKELYNFLKTNAGTLRIEYNTSDFSNRFGQFIDITNIDYPDNSVDLVICHRVLEHVYDDKKALSEVHRILSQNGMLNVSVPIAFDKDDTVDWFIPDPLRHGHVRMYGNNFSALLGSYDFKVEEERWHFQQQPSTLQKEKSYNLLMYNAIKE